MSGEKNLSLLLASMKADLHPETFVFVTRADGQLPTPIRPKMMFEENEGTTFIIQQTEAEGADLPYEFPSRMITLNIHSALDAVGFMAKIASALAQAGLSVNPVSAFYHDHLFIAEKDAQTAMDVLDTFHVH